MLHETNRSMNNFILFCKGWYMPVVPNTSLLDQLNVILDMDGYGPYEGYNRYWNEVLEILMNNLDEINSICREEGLYELTATRLIRRVNDWRRFTEGERCYEYYFAKAIISFVGTIRSNGVFKIDPPVYSKKLKKMGFISPLAKFGTTYSELNRHARDSFSEKVKK